MADVRAVMGDYRIEASSTTTFKWIIDWHCWPLDRTGQTFAMTTETEVAQGDSAAVTSGKIIDSATAKVPLRFPGYTLPRTNVYMVTFTRGS